MNHSTQSRAWLLALGLAACTGKPAHKQPAEAEKADVTPPAEVAAAAPPAPASEPAKVAANEPAVPAAPAVPDAPAPVEPPLDPAVSPTDPLAPPEQAAEPSAPAELVATAVTAVDHVATWREVTTLPADTVSNGFRYFATGVLAGSEPSFYTLDATGAWGPASVLELPGPVVGHWPDEAWAVETTPTRERGGSDRIRLMRLRGQSRWVPQEIEGRQVHDSDGLGAMNKSWKVGYLVKIGYSLVRVAGNGAEDPPKPEVRGTLMDLTESKAGDLYTLSIADDAEHDFRYFVQTACADAECVKRSATPLPPGSWEWARVIPRQKHSVSMTLYNETANRTNHILHYETGGWKLEALADDAKLLGIWPTPDGGLWAQTSDTLLHRDPDGAWRKVALPEGVQPSGPVFAAMTTKMAELVILGVRDGAQVVLATAAKTQSPG